MRVEAVVFEFDEPVPLLRVICPSGVVGLAGYLTGHHLAKLVRIWGH